MKKGDKVRTPRFLWVTIQEVYGAHGQRRLRI